MAPLKLPLLPAVLFIAAGCSGGTDPRVKVVIPREFRGEIRIIQDRNGAEINRKDGISIYKINREGYILTRNLDDFTQWHQNCFSFDNGENLNYYSYQPDCPPGQLAVFGGEFISGSTYKGNTIIYFVGTKDEVSNWHR